MNEAPIRFVIQRVSGRGVTLNQVRGNVLRIGRGTNAHLRSESPAVALEHADIEATDEGFFVSDAGSVTGTYVDGRAVERARLVKGSVVEIGDLRIEVKTADPGKPLFVAVSSATAQPTLAAEPAAPVESEPVAQPATGGRALRLKKTDFAAAYRLRRPYFTKISAIAIVVIAALVFVAKVTEPQNRRAFMPGGVSSAHARARDATGRSVANRCDACHEPWRGVSDRKCSACHAKAPHSEVQAAAPTCADCHPEHRGATRLAAMPDTRCVGCHGNLLAHVQWGVQPHIPAKITSFGVDHPDFRFPADPDDLRFNHALHLRLTTGPHLTCTTCHAMRGPRPAAITFSADCQSCHRLTFDSRFPTAEVPHGIGVDAVYGAIIAAYSNHREVLARSAAERREMLRSMPPTPEATRALVAAEQVIKTKCALCHDVQRSASAVSVVKPVIRTQWLERVRFDHQRHQTVDCQSCHDQARSSKRTADVLLPSRHKCEPCHAATKGGAATASTCVTCHEYHPK